MPTLKLHYEGWLALPATLRQKLGLNTGDRLDIDLIDGAILLRPASAAGRPIKPEKPIVALTSGAPATPAPVKRKPGRPRKVRATDEFVPAAEAKPKRPRGRPRKVTVALEPAPALGPVVSEPWKLRKKADLQAAVPEPVQVAASNPHPAPVKRSGTGDTLEERRPFRNVEVRKLGPGRGSTKQTFQPDLGALSGDLKMPRP